MLTGECILTEAQAPRLHVPGTLSMGIQGNCQVSLLQILKNRPFLTGILESLGRRGGVHDQDQSQGISECAGLKTRKSGTGGGDTGGEKKGEGAGGGGT